MGQDCYFASTTLANLPGLTLLHSRDLGKSGHRFAHVADWLEGLPRYELAPGSGAYPAGIYAPSLRQRDGVFYVA